MKQPFCCLKMYNNKMLLRNNMFIDGFIELFWKKENENRTFKATLNKATVLIGNLKEGYYVFYARNPVTFHETEPMTFYCYNELPSYVINRLWSVADITAMTYTSDLKMELLEALENSSNSLLDILYKKYCLIENIEEFEEDIFYKLIVCQEAYENLQHSNNNRDGAGFARLVQLPNPTVYVPQDITTVKVYKDDKLFGVWHPDNFTVELPLQQGLFEIQLLNGSCLYSTLKHCNLSERCMIKLWEDYLNDNMTYLDIVENNLSSSIDFSTFSIAEMTNYKEEIGMNPVNPVIPRIKVTEQKYDRGVQLLISGVAYADISRHTFFVSGRDTEFKFESVQNEFFPLIADTNSFTVNFDPAPNMIDSEAFLYVIDENGKIVSKVTRCIFDEDPTTMLADYYEKIRTAEISSYGRRLGAQILSSYPAGWTYTQEMITRCLENTEISADNMLENLLADINNASSDINKDLLAVEVLKDFISSSNYDLNFFSEGGFLWRPYTHVVVAEPSNTGYVLCVMANFEGSNVYSKHYVHSFPDHTVEVLLNQYGRYIIFAISEDDYSLSGFMYLNTVNNFLKSYLLNVEVR